MNEEREPHATRVADRFFNWFHRNKFLPKAKKLVNDLEVTEHLGLSEPEKMYFIFETARYYQSKTGGILAGEAKDYQDDPLSGLPVIRSMVQVYKSYEQSITDRGEVLGQMARTVAEDYDFDPRRSQYLSRISNLVTSGYWSTLTGNPNDTLEVRRERFKRIVENVD